MFGLGWVGAGGGAVRRICTGRERFALPALAAYGWATGLAYGALINLWFWPFQAGTSTVSWGPGLGVVATARHYWRFYLLTSLAWDSARAFVNAGLILALGRPLLRLLVRFRSRLDVTWTAVPAGPAPGSME
jgi:energy-coupling factor transport system substrate-specific component